LPCILRGIGDEDHHEKIRRAEGARFTPEDTHRGEHGQVHHRSPENELEEADGGNEQRVPIDHRYRMHEGPCGNAY